MDPQRLVVQAMCTDDHGGRQVGRLEDVAPRRDQRAVAGENDGLGRSRRDIRRDLPATVVFECLGDELARCGRHWPWLLDGPVLVCDASPVKPRYDGYSSRFWGTIKVLA